MTINNDLCDKFQGQFIEKVADFLFDLSEEYDWNIWHFSEEEKTNQAKKFFFMFYSLEAASLIIVETTMFSMPFGSPKKNRNFYVHPNTHKVLRVWSKELKVLGTIDFESLLHSSYPLFQSYEKSERTR
jgi:hypothetical protein